MKTLVCMSLIIVHFLCYCVKGSHYSLSRKTSNGRENFWNVYCFATNRMRDETTKDNQQTAEWINHDLCETMSWLFLPQRIFMFSNTEFLSLFQLCCHQRIDMNDILRKSEVINQEDRIRQSKTGHLRARKNEPITSDASRCLFLVQFKRSCYLAVISGF